MGWKEWPSWLKGGIIGGVVNLGIFLIVYLISTQIQNPMHYNWMKLDYYPYFGKIIANWVFIPGLLGLFFLGIFLGILNLSFRGPSIYEGGGFGFGGSFTSLGSFLILITSFIFYFLVGTLIGWIIGKIKNK